MRTFFIVGVFVLASIGTVSATFARNDTCFKQLSCPQCTEAFGCGWCASHGRCVAGDNSGPLGIEEGCGQFIHLQSNCPVRGEAYDPFKPYLIPALKSLIKNPTQTISVTPDPESLVDGYLVDESQKLDIAGIKLGEAQVTTMLCCCFIIAYFCMYVFDQGCSFNQFINLMLGYSIRNRGDPREHSRIEEYFECCA